MRKIYGIAGLLMAICVITCIIEPKFATLYNLQNIIRWTSLFAIIGIGATFVIVTGGIDLSIGSVVGITGSLLPWLMIERGWSAPAALFAMLVFSICVGVAHGLLITKLKLQPFIVTLCTLLIYRGYARGITQDKTQGFLQDYESLRQLAIGKFMLPGVGIELPIPLLIMTVIAVLAAILLNKTIYGRYLLALGNNEKAALYSGINTDGMIILAYVISAVLAGIGGILFALDVNSVQPSAQGSSYEFYAIAAAVLGGCSLRGGEASILGVILGTAIMRVLYNAINILGLKAQWESAVIGKVILVGVIADELIRRYTTKRRAIKAAASVEQKAAPEPQPANVEVMK
jgi:ribose transport system permease protein